MRVLLINPYYPISETPSPPLGLAYLAAALETAGIEVKILDFVVYPYRREGLESFLKRFKPHIAGATAVTMTFDLATRIIKDVKTINPEILTVMGGPHVTFWASQTLRAIPQLDVIVIGEGEETLVELSHAVEHNRPLHTVNGIAHRIGSEVNVTAKRNFIQELDSLPMPARHLLPLGRYRALKLPISMTTSRGCPYQCIFCVGRKMVGAKVRKNSPERVATELQNLAHFDFHQINIADDLFTADKQHCNAVCDEIIKRNLKTTWTSFARVDTISEALLAKMKAAGCTAVSFGIESADPKILKTIKKGIRLEQVVDAVRMCRRVGVRPYASFILGLPGETQDTIKETAAFAEKLQREGLAYGYHTLAPFPGTEVREKADKLGLRILTSDWSKYNANRAVAETARVSRRTLDKVVIAWENKYNQYLQGIQRQMQAGTAGPDEVRQIENLERTVILYDLMMQNSIEACGTWPDDNTQTSKAKNLAMLVDRIIRIRDMNPSKLKTSLRHAMIDENLELTRKNGKISWKWRELLPAESLT